MSLRVSGIFVVLLFILVCLLATAPVAAEQGRGKNREHTDAKVDILLNSKKSSGHEDSDSDSEHDKEGEENSSTTKQSEENAEEDADANGGALATSSLSTLEPTCWHDGEQYETKAHPTDPRKYYCGSHIMWFRTNYRRSRYVHRCGKWYKNRRSNQYYVDGKWKREIVAPHPTNPTLYRRACKWIQRPDTEEVQQYFKSPTTGIWYRNQQSSEYYAAGTWGHYETNRPNPTDPNMVLRAGTWVPNLNARGRRLWSNRCNRWWMRGPGAGVKSFTYYKKGKWHVIKSYWKYRNDPFYKWDPNTCKFVQKPVGPKTRAYFRKGRHIYHRGALPGGGYWFRDRRSLWYYKNLSWRLASSHLRDPHWRRNSKNGKWYRINSRTHPEVRKYVRRGGLYYRDSSLREYYFYGSWVPSNRGININASIPVAVASPTDFHKLVKKVMKNEFGKFMNWFLKSKRANRRGRRPRSKRALRSGYGRIRRHRNWLVATRPPPLPASVLNSSKFRRARRKAFRKKMFGPYVPEPGINGARAKFDVEPANGHRLRVIPPHAVESSEYRDYGRPEKFNRFVGRSPDFYNPSQSDSLRFGPTVSRDTLETSRYLNPQLDDDMPEDNGSTNIYTNPQFDIYGNQRSNPNAINGYQYTNPVSANNPASNQQPPQ